MKQRSKRAYFISLILMVLGVLLQGLLLSGHIPFVHLSQFRSHVTPLPFQQYQTVVASRDQNTTPVIRMRRPTFQTGMIFPQWGTNAYDSTDKNWQVGLKDIRIKRALNGLNYLLISISPQSPQRRLQSQKSHQPQRGSIRDTSAQARYYHVFVVPLLSVGGALTWSGSINSLPLNKCSMV